VNCDGADDHWTGDAATAALLPLLLLMSRIHCYQQNQQQQFQQQV
jgi:hypothetical protein